MKKDITLNTLCEDARLKDVLKVLNKGVYGIVFIISRVDNVVRGVFTDGDVRRALLDGAALDSSVADYMQTNFIFGREDDSREDNIRLMDERVRHLPIVDKKGCLVDFLSWAEMWKLPVMEPTLGGNELKYVSDCISKNWISSQGSYVKLFEKEFAAFSGCAKALTTTSGTTALHLALEALGVGPGDEVIVPDLTFGATANVVVHAGAVPVFVDVSREHWTIDPELLEESLSPKTRAIIPVHLYGHPCDMEPIVAFARKHNLFVIEDCAEALGARYKSRLVGSFGEASCFSFFSNKVITTGEGGMVVTNDLELAEKMQVLRDHGMNKEKRYWHDYPGFNYRMTNLQAAVGVAQLEQVHTFLQKRRDVAAMYSRQLSGVAGITLPPEMEWAHNIYWLYSILVDDVVTGVTGEELIRMLGAEGVDTRPFFYPLHGQPAYSRKGRNRNCSVSVELSGKGVSLPSSITLSSEEITRVCGLIKRTVQHSKVMRDLTV